MAEQRGQVVGHDKLLVRFEEDRLVKPVFDRNGYAAADERRLCCFVRRIGSYVETGAQYTQVYPGSMNDKRLLWIAGHVKKGFACQVNLAAAVAVIPVICQATAGIEPDLGAIGQREMCPGAVGSSNLIEGRRGRGRERVRGKGLPAMSGV